MKLGKSRPRRRRHVWPRPRGLIIDKPREADKAATTVKKGPSPFTFALIKKVQVDEEKVPKNEKDQEKEAITMKSDKVQEKVPKVDK